ncbi:M14 family zinc carboxypeptidase [Wenzhouxiangella marina]|uniref:Peptidase M14 domain-containing protein n=1 Tax=Wenzhouxiangella marina TaxID=1579979 RepID=A0A0K0XT24_9GAMM|nr:M14 family zinc carboxypeptidase [Wenzhouxiangella marina]AKS40838.1 hypothetical protein WM2015_456 [Wenzhouxiangella marina]MBB6087712.1 hypothetical protein [Wenzhouxiangella marina]
MSRRLILGSLALLLLSSSAFGQRLANWTEGNGELGLGYPVPIPVDTPLPFDGFRTYAGLHSRHQDLMLQSDRVSGEVVGQSRNGREIWAYRLAASGDRTPEGLPRSAVFYTGGIHAREWQSPEVVTGLMERLVAGQGDHFLTDFVADHVNVVVLPVMNIDGFLQTQANPSRNWLETDNRNPQFWPRDGRMRRKNLRGTDGDFFTTGDHLAGVDLNRNNPPFWPGPPETGIQDDLTWRGPSAQSEPEIQAMLAAAGLAPADRLRFFADMHSYTSVFFSVHTSNLRRNAIQSRLFSTLSNHHAALPGNRVYVDSVSSIDVGIGTTSEYFGQLYQIPSATWEIEPGENGAVDYGGFGNNGHDGFILPESEIRRVRENLAETMLVAAYHMADPPHVAMAEVVDVATGAVVWSAHWDDAENEMRDFVNQSLAPLVPGRAYELWMAFSKPMRWRENGQVVPFPGRSASSINLNLWIESGNDVIAADFGPPEWLDQAGGAPNGYHRYRDDAFRIAFTISDAPETLAQIDEINAGEDGIHFTVLTSDLTGNLLDANPATRARWEDGAWADYDSASGSLDSGGADRSLELDLRVAAGDPGTEAVRGVHSAMWIDPDRGGEGWVIEVLPDGQAVGYWFTYDEEGHPRWLLGQGPVVANQIRFENLLAPVGGRFGPGFDPDEVELLPAGSARLVFSDCEQGWFDYRAFGQTQRLPLNRLTRGLGLDCGPSDVPPPDRAVQNGSWFDPDHAGEGYTVQWLDNGQVLVMWFSYDATGQQYWMLGQGESQAGDDRILLDNVLSARGARFGRAFDPQEVELFDWGSIEMQLGCETGSASYQSLLPEFGSGDFELLRLSYIDGLTTCPPGN